MNTVRARLVLMAALFTIAAGTWVAHDPHGLRLWFRLGDDVAQLDKQNNVLLAQVDLLRRKATALRQDPHALVRAARESGYVHPNEILIELK